MYLEALELDDPTYTEAYLRRLPYVSDIQLARDGMRLRTFILIYDCDDRPVDLARHRLVFDAIECENSRRAEVLPRAASLVAPLGIAIVALVVGVFALACSNVFRHRALRSSRSSESDDGDVASNDM